MIGFASRAPNHQRASPKDWTPRRRRLQWAQRARENVTTFSREAWEKMELPEGIRNATAIRKPLTAEQPSVDIGHVDDAVDYHLIPKIDGLWPRPTNDEEEDPSEALRSNLRVAITEVLLGHGVKVVKP
jgi:hypothetical protein